MFCRKCGNQIPDDSDFCYKCGAPTAEKPAEGNSKIWDYNEAVNRMNSAKSAGDFEAVENIFEALGDYKDSRELLKKCREEKIPKIYENAVESLNSAQSAGDFDALGKCFASLGGYRDSDELLKKCEYNRKLWIYNNAYKKMNAAKSFGDLEEAIKLFRSVSGFEDSDELAEQCVERRKKLLYDDALSKMINADKMIKAEAIKTLKKAENQFRSIGGYRNSKELAEQCVEKQNNINYNAVVKQFDSAKSIDDYEKTAKAFERLGNVRDSEEMSELCLKKANELRENFKRGDIFNKYSKAVTALECSNDISTLNRAAEMFNSLENFRDSKELEQECFQKIFALKKGEKYFGRTHNVTPFDPETELIAFQTDSDNSCPNCGSKIVDTDSAFCNKCGFKLNVPPIETNDTDESEPGGFCRYCGKPLLTDLDFCPYCSADIK